MRTRMSRVLCPSAVRLLRLATVGVVAALTSPELHGAEPGWVIVIEDEPPSALLENVQGLQQDLRELVDGEVRLVAESLYEERDDDRGKAPEHRILVGRADRLATAHRLLQASQLTSALSGEPAFVQSQGYLVGEVHAAEDAPRTLLAVGWDVGGATYAASHLRTRLQMRNSRLTLELTAPQSVENTHFTYEVRRPSFEERGVYYNLAWHELGNLTPIGWDDAQWEQWIDKLVCCQLTHLYFFLWSDSLDFAQSEICAGSRNKALREQLQRMIRIAHRRGLKVGYHFAPTQVPSDIFQANRQAIGASGVYAEYGFPAICSASPQPVRFGSHTWNSAWELMLDVYRRQLEHYREADAFQIWFYDPAGCFCGPERHDCRARQALRLMEQTDAFATLARAVNPSAELTVSLWPIWVLEPMYKLSYRDEFLDMLVRYAPATEGRRSFLTVSDSLTGSTNLKSARSRGLRMNGFFYPTNVETGCCLLTPMLETCEQAIQTAQQHEVSGIHHMRIEAASKFANTFIASRLYWDAATTPTEAVRQYAQWVANSDAQAATELYEAMLELDAFMCRGADGVNHAESGLRIRSLIDSALSRLGPERSAQHEWLLTTGRAVEIIGAAIDHAERLPELNRQFTAVMAASPTFGRTRTPLERYVSWIAKGFNQEHF